jgi:transcription elongation factor GreA
MHCTSTSIQKMEHLSIVVNFGRNSLDVMNIAPYNCWHVYEDYGGTYMSVGGQSDAKPERKIYRLTPDGYAKKKERLVYLQTVKRKEVADYIHEAKEAGDISESGAYEEAKREQARVEGEIISLERLLAVAEVMTPDMHGTENGPAEVRIGMEVEVETDSGSTRTFKLVETFEADPKTGLISDQSPVGKALMGHKEHDEVTVSTPGGVSTYTILSIKPML